MRRLLLAVPAVLLALLPGGCAKRDCESAAPAFELRVRVGDLAITALSVVATLNDQAPNTWEQGIKSEMRADGVISVRGEVGDAAGGKEFTLEIDVTAKDGQGNVVARGHLEQKGQPNACNTFDVDLRSSASDARPETRPDGPKREARSIDSAIRKDVPARERAVTDRRLEPRPPDLPKQDIGCTATTCLKGCCANGTCIAAGTDNTKCGWNGAACTPCQGGTVCSGKGTCVPPCAPGTCSNGCCKLNICVPFAAQYSNRCGTGGAQCSQCPTNHYCQGGLCKAATCISCAVGCCTNGTPSVCLPGTTSTACGHEGSPCLSCSLCALLPKGGGTCAQPCGSSSCTGCCKNSTCIPLANQSDSECGILGQICAQCSQDRPVCCDGVCMAACISDST